MGRRSHSRALGVWANGRRVGRWTIPANGPMELLYDPSWVESREARPLSLSLPMNLDGLPIRGERVGFYFDNLLPDSEVIRRRMAERFHTGGEAFDLLEAVGRDCVGAVQLLPEDEAPQDVLRTEAEPLSDAEIARRLLSVTAEPSHAGGDDDDDAFRISIAGAQEKTAFLWHKGRWCKPHGATPTTHIFKLPLGLVGDRQMDMSTSVENEWLCAKLLAGYGLPIAPCDIKTFGPCKVLVITRFDRSLHSSGAYLLRLPQEDFCQATGTPSSRRYESDGGPGLAEIAGILQGSEARDEDLATLLRAQLIFFMLAATDGHAKNFSLRLLARGRYRLTPLYDVLSAWPVVGSRHNQVHPKKLKLAMALTGKNKHFRRADMRRRHFNLTARRCGLGADMDALIDQMIAETPRVIEAVAAGLPRGFPARLFDAVVTGLRAAATELAADVAGT